MLEDRGALSPPPPNPLPQAPSPFLVPEATTTPSKEKVEALAGAERGGEGKTGAGEEHSKRQRWISAVC